MRIYQQAAEDLAKKAATTKNSLTKRWAEEYYIKSLHERVGQLQNDIYNVTMQGLKKSAWQPVDAMAGLLEMASDTSFHDLFATIPENVMTEIVSGSIYKDRMGLSDRIWGATQKLEKDIDYIVNTAIAGKKSARELAEDLEKFVDPKAKKPWDWSKVYPYAAGKVDYNTQRLARTAINHSYFLANVKSCDKNPFVDAMHWELSRQHGDRQVIPFGEDVCDEYARHEEGLGPGNYPARKLPTPHPQCICSQYAVVSRSLKDIGDEIGRWAAGEDNPKLNNWLKSLKNPEKHGIIKMDLQVFAEKDIKRQESGSLKRAIRKYEARIDEHRKKLKNPEGVIPDWGTRDERYKAGLKKHWEKEISNFERSIQDRIDELKERGDYDD